MRLYVTSSTTSLIVVISATALIVLNAAITTLAQDVGLCRCTAKFEHFYDRRSLMQQQRLPVLPVDGDRSLSFRNYAYDYSDYYIDDDGYYVVEGVRVLPDDDPACDGSADDEERAGSDTTRPYKRDGILARVFGQGRSLLNIDYDDEEEEDGMVEDRPLQLRTLMGMMGGSGGMMSSSSSDPSDDYYNYYGKGKVRTQSFFTVERFCLDTSAAFFCISFYVCFFFDSC